MAPKEPPGTSASRPTIAAKPIQVKQGHGYFASGNKAVSGVKDLLKMSNDPNRGPVIKRDLL